MGKLCKRCRHTTLFSPRAQRNTNKAWWLYHRCRLFKHNSQHHISLAQGKSNDKTTATTQLNDIKARFGVIDIWRNRSKHERNQTWTGRSSADSSSLIHSRIDFFLLSLIVNQVVTGASIKSYAHSNHDLMTMTRVFETLQHDPAFWHL